MNNVKVSVLMLTFNHENFIAKAIESVVCQKFEYPFELIIHDDASTDNTQAIIREYAEKYPNIIRPIYQKENQFSAGRGIIHRFLGPMTKGEYICYLEGDDFWIDENKLQEQYDFITRHPEYSAVASRKKSMNESEEIIPYLHFKKDYVYNDKTIFHLPDIIHISTLMHKNIYKDEQLSLKYNQMKKCKMVGDWMLLIFLVDLGNIYVFKKNYSAYRKVCRQGASNYYSIRAFQLNKFDVLAKRHIANCKMQEFEGYNRVKYKYSRVHYAGYFLFEYIRSSKEEKAYAKKVYTESYIPTLTIWQRAIALISLWYPLYEMCKSKLYSYFAYYQTRKELGRIIKVLGND